MMEFPRFHLVSFLRLSKSIAASAVILAFCFPVDAFAEVQIIRIVEKGSRAQVHFFYQNDSNNTLATVKIECGLPGAKSKREKGMAYLSNHASGGIAPGYTFSGTVDVTLGGGKSEDITCADHPQPLILRE